VPTRLEESYFADDLAKKKFILILREPVARHFSEYEMRLRVCLKIYENDDHINLGNSKGRLDDPVRLGRNCAAVSFNYHAGIKKETHQFMSFAQWVHSPYGLKELSRGHYHEHIAHWLQFIKRDQLFIINFDYLIHNTTDVMTRLASFLELDKGWGDNVVLPKPKQVKPQAVLDCTTAKRLGHYYSKVNRVLVDYINNVTIGKPKDEPVFPDLIPPSNCADLTTPEGDDLLAGVEEDDAEGERFF